MGADGTAVVLTRDLTKHFGLVRAVEGLHLEVRSGEVFGFLGPNGAGKTTTIRLLLDFLRPTRGSVTVLGGSGADPDVRRRIGYLPADLHLDPRYRAGELYAFLASLRGGLDQAFLRALVDRFDLDPTRPVGELSTGNRRKVGIVQAFAHRPELLILDEPARGWTRCSSTSSCCSCGRQWRRGPRYCSPRTCSPRSNEWPTGWPSCGRAPSSR